MSIYSCSNKLTDPPIADRLEVCGRMYVAKSINADHEDLIHDVAYDFYGKRMATCSSDQKVNVFLKPNMLLQLLPCRC